MGELRPPIHLRARRKLEETSERFARSPDRHRPYYAATQRFRILEIKNFLAWNAKQAARAFLVCPTTILNWEHAADPESRTVGSTVRPIPPLRRAANVVQSTVQAMIRYGLGGQDLVSRTLPGPAGECRLVPRDAIASCVASRRRQRP